MDGPGAWLLERYSREYANISSGFVLAVVRSYVLRMLISIALSLIGRKIYKTPLQLSSGGIFIASFSYWNRDSAMKYMCTYVESFISHSLVKLEYLSTYQLFSKWVYT